MQYSNQYRHLLTLLMLGWVISNSSCKKILEQEPKNSTYDQVFWQTAKDCEFAIAGNYSLLRASFTATSSYEENAFRYNMYGDAQTTSTSYFTINYNGDGLEGIQEETSLSSIISKRWETGPFFIKPLLTAISSLKRYH
ncbi:hypothetical protein LWM68_00845 [Niabella sp. W65]|nr:hypothetical protein [Niabella sp. W65]MCH7361455.1 hypothetical protein [Niabella sp. W65]ULT45255.1 hypothetical protein KRR40_19405 [Niabella sp. I65]